MKKDTTFLHHDRQGTLRMVTWRSGPAPSKMTFDAWGELLAQTGSEGVAYTYTGQEWDEESNMKLFYLRNRYYDPSLGRFLTPDPLVSDLNSYSYCNNNPVMMSDPMGLNPKPGEPAPGDPDYVDPSYKPGPYAGLYTSMFRGGFLMGPSLRQIMRSGTIGGCEYVKSAERIEWEFLTENNLRKLSPDEVNSLRGALETLFKNGEIPESVYNACLNALGSGVVYAHKDGVASTDAYYDRTNGYIAIEEGYLGFSDHASCREAVALLSKEAVHWVFDMGMEEDFRALRNDAFPTGIGGTPKKMGTSPARDAGATAWATFYHQAKAEHDLRARIGFSDTSLLKWSSDWFDYWEPYDNSMDLYRDALRTYIHIDENHGK